ncbi:cryptochrome/photolyase family protein [Arthrobacter sp.]|uniref:cryptochrome/photolyase family protein n=1 Tax=Arthrobacter sp. TaxID=1667 RepID=UPI003A8D2797
MTSIMWFRDDLRIADNPALVAAVHEAAPVAIYILDEESAGIRPLGAAARWWLHEALVQLRVDLADRGIELVLRRGPAAEVLAALVREVEPTAVYWNRRYGMAERTVDTQVKEGLRTSGVHAESFQATLLHEPWTIHTGQGGHYRVFTPFWNQLRELHIRHPLDAPDRTSTRAMDQGPRIDGDDLDAWGLVPTGADWPAKLAAQWTPGEAAAWWVFEDFADGPVNDYAEGHDLPGTTGTSRLSPYLRWGHISPFQLWHALSSRPGPTSGGTMAYLRQLGWREFCWHLLYHHPQLATRNLRGSFDRFPWRWPDRPGAETPRCLRGDPPFPASEAATADEPVDAWKSGATGIPMVDAGMRELWETGWMHNRVRMLVASFLTKNMGVHWQVGEQWFWETLVDADEASNPANWQWVAGSGADASPFFRIFNPNTQARRFDAQGNYVNRWVPDALLPGYPEPLEDLADSRRRALDDYRTIQGS